MEADIENNIVNVNRNVEFLLSIEKSLRNWRVLLVWTLVGAAIGAIIGFSKPKTYTSGVMIAPELTTRSNMGSLSSLASLAGINDNMVTMTDAIHPNLFPELIHSSNFCIRLFDMPVTVEVKDSTVNTDLYNYIVSYCKSPWWNTVIALPGKAKDLVKRILNPSEEQEGYSALDTLKLTKEQEMVVNTLINSIKTSVDKESYTLSVSVTLQDPLIAGQLANYVAEQLKDFVLEYRMSKAGDDLAYLTKIHDQSKEEYIQAHKKYTNYVDAHQGVVSNSSLAIQQQLRSEYELKSQMYSQSAQRLLAAKAKIQEEAPVLFVIQPGVAPNTGQPSISKLIILCGLLGAVLRLAWVVFGFDYLFRRFLENVKE